MRRLSLRAWPSNSLRLLFVLGVWSFAGCSQDDAPAVRPAGPTLGQDIFGVLCDRVGAQSLHEDLDGSSYNEICHGDATTVDQKKLPPAPNADVRKQSVAKVEALARHKPDLIAALDTVFPDDIVVGKNLDATDPIASCDPISSKTRRDQLRGLLQRLLPTGTDDVVPESSRAAAKTLEPLTDDDGVSTRVALSHFAARRGYMPPELETGLLASVLTAPRLRDLLAATTHAIGPDADPYGAPGTKSVGYDKFKAFTAAVQEDLGEPVDQQAKLVETTDAAGRPILSRPRTTLELGRAILLTENPAFSNGAPIWVAKRDYRGMAVVAKDSQGHLPGIFVDADGDGLADVDRDTGRFQTGGKPIPDPFTGDTKNTAYQFTDARATFASALFRHIAPLADPDNGKESVMNLAEGFEPILRDREALLDLVHAGGQIMADPGSDGALALFGQLFTTQPDLMARLTGNLLDVKATLDAHPEATLPDGNTLFNDLIDVAAQMVSEPGLVEDVLNSMSDDRAQYIKEAIPPMMLDKDRITYDPANINGLPINTTSGKGAGAPDTPVDRSQPNVGWNRSIFQRFLGLLEDTNGVTFCNKDQAILHGVILLGDGQYHQIDLPLEGPAPECGLVHIENLSVYYLKAMIGQAQLQFRPAFFNPDPPTAPVFTNEVLKRSTGIDGFWDATKDGRDPRVVYPRPEFLNRQVFYKIDPNFVCDDNTKYQTNCVLKDLQGMHIPSAGCTPRSIPDPLAGDNTAVDKPPVGATITGLRTCDPGQNLDERDPDTLFALEYNHGYDAFSPLAEAFAKHHKEQLLIDLMIAINKSWKVEGGAARVEPALAEIIKGDLIPSLGALAKATNDMKVDKCVAQGANDCAQHIQVPAVTVLADGVRAMVDQTSGIFDRKGNNVTSTQKGLTIIGLLKTALDEEEAVLAKDKTKQNKYLTARSHIIDEFLTINGRGVDAKFADPGIPQLAPVVIGLLRAQRLAKCDNDPKCPALRSQLALDVQDSLEGKVFNSGLDLFDVVLADNNLRGEIGRMVAYMFRQDSALGGTQSSSAASSTPFSGSKKGPGALDQSIAAFVDALGSLGDLSDVRATYPFIAKSFDNIDPQLSLLSRLNARAYDAAGNEICAKELDPEEAIRNMLARLALPVTVPGKPAQPALQIFMDALGDVNRVDASNQGPLAPDDYTNVFKNVHDLLTDPQSGLEQLYASVKNATKR
jgi:hypothetical protein